MKKFPVILINVATGKTSNHESIQDAARSCGARGGDLHRTLSDINQSFGHFILPWNTTEKVVADELHRRQLSYRLKSWTLVHAEGSELLGSRKELSEGSKLSLMSITRIIKGKTIGGWSLKSS